MTQLKIISPQLCRCCKLARGRRACSATTQTRRDHSEYTKFKSDRNTVQWPPDVRWKWQWGWGWGWYAFPGFATQTCFRSWTSTWNHAYGSSNGNASPTIQRHDVSICKYLPLLITFLMHNIIFLIKLFILN